MSLKNIYCYYLSLLIGLLFPGWCSQAAEQTKIMDYYLNNRQQKNRWFLRQFHALSMGRCEYLRFKQYRTIVNMNQIYLWAHFLYGIQRERSEKKEKWIVIIYGEHKTFDYLLVATIFFFFEHVCVVRCFSPRFLINIFFLTIIMCMHRLVFVSLLSCLISLGSTYETMIFFFLVSDSPKTPLC